MDSLAALVRASRTLAHAELEVRLGTVRGDAGAQFHPGVPAAVFHQLERDMDEDEGLVASDARWVEHVDYHYTLPSRARVRTRVTFDTQRLEMDREHVSKQRHSAVTMCHRDAPPEGEAFRVALAAEVPVAVPPQACLPTLVRVTQRRRFENVRDGKTVWAYELSKTWSAASRTAVEYLHHAAPPTYEVECELVDKDGSYRAALTDAEVAESLLIKGRVLLGESAACQFTEV